MSDDRTRGDSKIIIIILLASFMILSIYVSGLPTRIDRGLQIRSASMKIEETLNEMTRIAYAVLAYHSDHGAYPMSMDGVGRTIDLNRLTSPVSYIDSIPDDPFGNPFQYIAFKYPTQMFQDLYGDYVIYSYGFDGKRDTYLNTYLKCAIRNVPGVIPGDIVLEQVGRKTKPVGLLPTPDVYEVEPEPASH